MKKIIIAALAVISLTTACSDEEETLFTDYDKNWFVIDDNPADPAQHAAYEFYRDFGVPVFYNDTIGSQQRVDLWGNTYTHYETLTLSYAMGGIRPRLQTQVSPTTHSATRVAAPRHYNGCAKRSCPPYRKRHISTASSSSNPCIAWHTAPMLSVVSTPSSLAMPQDLVP